MNILSFQRPAIASFACLVALLFAASVYAAVGEKHPPAQEKRQALLPFFFIAPPQGGTEIVDGLGLSRCTADAGQAAVVAQGIDQARFTYVGTAEEGDFRHVPFGVLVAADRRRGIGRLDDIIRSHQDFTSA